MAVVASDWLRHFELLLWNRLTEFNETIREAQSQRPITSLCCLGRSKKKQDRRPYLWLIATYSTSPLNTLNGIQRYFSGSKISTSSSKFVFFGLSGKQDGRPDLWLVEHFSTPPMEPLNRIQWNLTGNKITTSFTKFVFFWQIENIRSPSWPLIDWNIFDFSSDTAWLNSTKRYR